MSKKATRLWMIAMIINLVLNVMIHFCSSCNETLNYLASTVAAFALGFFIQEYHYGKNEGQKA